MEFSLRADLFLVKLPEQRGSRRDSCTLWPDKLLTMVNIYMRCVAIKKRRLFGRYLEVYLNSDLCRYFRNERSQYSFKHSKTKPFITSHCSYECFYPVLLMSYCSKRDRASHSCCDHIKIIPAGYRYENYFL